MPKKNGFVIYAESRRAEFLAAGLTLTGSLTDLVPLCSHGWSALSDMEKKHFSEEAKRYNQQLKAGGSGQSSPSPPPPPKIGKKSLKKMADEDADKKVVEDLMTLQNNRQVVDGIFAGNKLARQNDWMSQPIVICYFNVYIDPNYQLLYLPAEVGLTALSLQHGVLDNFARVIDSGPIPLGYNIEAIQMAKRLGLPKIGTVAEFADVRSLMMILEDFLRKYNVGKLNGDGDTLHVFAFDSEYQTIGHCFEWLFKKSGYPFQVKVLSIEQFVYLASVHSSNGPSGKNASMTVSPYRTFGEPLTEKFIYPSAHPTCFYGIFANENQVDAVVRGMDNYKYFEELCCVYHVETGEEIQNCALNLSNRYAFNILEYLTLSNTVEIVPGAHYPQVDDAPLVEKKRRYFMLRCWGLTEMEQGLMNQTSSQETRMPGATNVYSRVKSKPKEGNGKQCSGIRCRRSSAQQRIGAATTEHETQGRREEKQPKGKAALSTTDGRTRHPNSGRIPCIFYAPK